MIKLNHNSKVNRCQKNKIKVKEKILQALVVEKSIYQYQKGS